MFVPEQLWPRDKENNIVTRGLLQYCEIPEQWHQPPSAQVESGRALELTPVLNQTWISHDPLWRLWNSSIYGKNTAYL